MELYQGVALFGTALGLSACFLRKSSFGRIKVSPRWVFSSVGFCLGLGLVYCLIEGFGWFRPVTYAPSDPSLLAENFSFPPGEYPPGPLALGTKAPPFQAQGWINGPPSEGTMPPRLTVVDIWALW
jgi:hypothetical protein